MNKANKLVDDITLQKSKRARIVKFLVNSLVIQRVSEKDSDAQKL